MTPPQLSQPARQHPRVFCAEDGCGHQLPTGFSSNRGCPWCSGRRRRYEQEFSASLGFTGTLETIWRFWRERPVWAAVQTFLLMLSLAVGFAALFFSLRILGLASFIVAAVITVVAYYVPQGRVLVESNRTHS